jgi:hypothetical protein
MQLNPQYGCLKRGNLPTYRNYIQQQPRSLFHESSRGQISGGLADDNDDVPTRDNMYEGQHNRSPEEYENPSSEIPTNTVDPSKVKLKYMRQKRTNSRTFKIGKSKNQPKVGVLISNRTIRKGITNQGFLLKQTPMHEIRKFLEKRGLVKVGTAAPNEVLRKMYESSKMMCGEVYNHNSETLLHNFIHMK